MHLDDLDFQLAGACRQQSSEAARLRSTVAPPAQSLDLVTLPPCCFPHERRTHHVLLTVWFHCTRAQASTQTLQHGRSPIGEGMIVNYMFLSLLVLRVSAGPLLTATVSSYTDASCTQLSTAKPNPTLFGSTCTFYQNGPPLVGNSVSVTFQSCATSVMKLNSWVGSSGSSASCIGTPSNVVQYNVGTCTSYTDSSSTTLYYKVLCSPASALSVSASLFGALIFIMVQ